MIVSVEMHFYRAVIAIGVFAALACFGIILAVHFWRVLPVWDQWETVFLYQRWSEHGWWAAGLGGQQNEHRPLLTNLLFLADFEFFRGTGALARVGLISYNFHSAP